MINTKNAAKVDAIPYSSFKIYHLSFFIAFAKVHFVIHWQKKMHRDLLGRYSLLPFLTVYHKNKKRATN